MASCEKSIMSSIIRFLESEPLLLLFIVSGLGYLLGQIKIKNISLGVAAVLFVGLAFGALSPNMEIPTAIVELGLIIFVYTIGLSSGPGFFASFRGDGIRDNIFVLLMLVLAAAMSVVAAAIFGLKSTVTAGMFAGSLTNTPALASLLDTISKNAPPDQMSLMLTEPVIGYSVAYPMGVIGMLIAVYAMQRVFKVDYVAEAKSLRQYNVVEKELYTRTVLVSNPDMTGVPISELFRREAWEVVLTRLKRGEVQTLTTGQTELAPGDLVSFVGTPEDVDKALAGLGILADEQLELDRHDYDFRRMFVSNPEIAGRSLADLNLPQTYSAIVTRVRRGDIDLLAHGSTILELGDRVRVVARREDMPGLAQLFGDSYRALSEINLVSLNLGLALGVLVGLIPIPLPGGVTISLGFAGGPLIVGLILGTMRRTGPIVWSIPYSANLTLRQIGLIMLLAGIGVRSGYTFVTNFTASGGVQVFISAAIITTTIALLTLFIGHRLLKIPYGLLTGILSGLGTQPATLGFALQQAGNELPNLGYALAFPVATVSKIVIAQLLLLFLSR